MIENKPKTTKKQPRSSSKNPRVTPKGVMQKAIDPAKSAKFAGLTDGDFKENQGFDAKSAAQYNTAQPSKKLVPTAFNSKKKSEKPPSKTLKSSRPLAQTRTSIHRP